MRGMGAAGIEDGSLIAGSRKDNLYIHAAMCSISMSFYCLLVRYKIRIRQMNKILSEKEGGYVHDIGDPVLLARGAANHLNEIAPFPFEGRKIILLGEL